MISARDITFKVHPTTVEQPLESVDGYITVGARHTASAVYPDDMNSEVLDYLKADIARTIWARLYSEAYQRAISAMDYMSSRASTCGDMGITGMIESQMRHVIEALSPDTFLKVSGGGPSFETPAGADAYRMSDAHQVAEVLRHREQHEGVGV